MKNFDQSQAISQYCQTKGAKSAALFSSGGLLAPEDYIDIAAEARANQQGNQPRSKPSGAIPTPQPAQKPQPRAHRSGGAKPQRVAVREEEIKNKLSRQWFAGFDCTEIIGAIDFAVLPSSNSNQSELFKLQSFLWAEAKTGDADISKSLAQLILTIGKARTFTRHLPPKYLGVFDAKKIAFIEYHLVQDIFNLNDFNWKVTPSNKATKEFKLIEEKISEILGNIHHFELTDETSLSKFISLNFKFNKEDTSKIQIDRNNFIPIYNLWLEAVQPTISIDWEKAKEVGLLDGDFYLADILSKDNSTIQDKLEVLLDKTHYVLGKKIDEIGLFSTTKAYFKDKQKAHNHFWRNYDRPPLEQYWDYIVERRDLLVPQDIRERKGSFFTPQVWVALSQHYLAETLGAKWQEDYVIWDLAAGTGNLLAGLANRFNIFASTIDKQDVEVIKQRIENGANLVPGNIFQFDFLNDPLDSPKIPAALREILRDPLQRRKLLIYINPPYAEATTASTVTGTGTNKSEVATANKTNKQFSSLIGKATNELFALFMARIYKEIPDCKLGIFSKVKFIQGANFTDFKDFFKAQLLAGFVVPADTFDNVKGNFPISFTIWNTMQKVNFTDITLDVFGSDRKRSGEKIFYANLGKTLNAWAKTQRGQEKNHIGILTNYPADFQNQGKVFIQNNKSARNAPFLITAENLQPFSVYFSVRNAIPATWLNDRDQFLWPSDSWKKDLEFQSDCLAFMLLHTQNRIASQQGINHWIPFTEDEVEAKASFTSRFMTDFIAGRIKDPAGQQDLFNAPNNVNEITFSPEAQALLNAGRELWRNYHANPAATDVNASFYDIRVFFQGIDQNRHLRVNGGDETYKALLSAVRKASILLAKKLEPKIYAHNFLR